MTESRPRLLIVGGPNGSGKTTFAEEYVARYRISYLGADAIAACLAPHDPFSARVAAGKQFVRELVSALRGGESRVVESTLAGRALAGHLRDARTLGYRIGLVFVTLDSPALCIARIRERVAQGGHPVPDADVHRRFWRARALFWNHYRLLADDWQLFGNTHNGFELIAVGQGERLTEADPALLATFICIPGVSMSKPHTAPVTDPEAFRLAVELLAIGNVAVRRAQERNRALNIPNYYSIGGRIVSDQEQDAAIIKEDGESMDGRDD